MNFLSCLVPNKSFTSHCKYVKFKLANFSHCHIAIKLYQHHQPFINKHSIGIVGRHDAYCKNVLYSTTRVGHTTGQGARVPLPIIRTVVVLVLVPISVCVHPTAPQLSTHKTHMVISIQSDTTVWILVHSHILLKCY